MVLCEIRYPLMGERAEVSAVLDGIEGFERGEDDEAHFWAVNDTWIWRGLRIAVHKSAHG